MVPAQATSIDTRGFRSLLDLVENTTHDSFDLYYGLFMYNQVGFAQQPDRKIREHCVNTVSADFRRVLRMPCVFLSN